MALVENGDVISIDVKKKVVTLEVPEDELAERRARLQKSPATDGQCCKIV